VLTSVAQIFIAEQSLENVASRFELTVSQVDRCECLRAAQSEVAGRSAGDDRHRDDVGDDEPVAEASGDVRGDAERSPAVLRAVDATDHGSDVHSVSPFLHDRSIADRGGTGHRVVAVGDTSRGLI
jgi:hypothetical protein